MQDSFSLAVDNACSGSDATISFVWLCHRAFPFIFFFFFQAEDGIRDDLVTGVQTCALPIYAPSLEDYAADPMADGARSDTAPGMRRPRARRARDRGSPPPSLPWARRGRDRKSVV